MLTISFVFKSFSNKEKDEFKDYLAKKTQRIERLLGDNQQLKHRLEVKAERFATKSAYKVSLVLHSPTTKILASEDDHTIMEAIDLALDKLITQLKKAFNKN